MYGQRVIGLVLTGGGSDGTLGLNAISEQKGVALAQDPKEAKTPYMPQNAISYDHVNRLVRIMEVPSLFLELTEGKSWLDQ